MTPGLPDATAAKDSNVVSNHLEVYTCTLVGSLGAPRRATSMRASGERRAHGTVHHVISEGGESARGGRTGQRI